MRTRSAHSMRAIAERLGLSVATVSRAIAGAPGVDQATRERVQAAVSSQSVRPQRLRRRRPHLGMLLLFDHPLIEHYPAAVLEGAMGYSDEMGLDLTVLRLERARCAEGPEAARRVLEHRCDGFITLFATPDLAPLLTALHDGGLPIAAVGDDPQVAGIGAIRPDNAGGMGQLMEHLRGLGHRRIALLHSTTGSADHRERTAAWQAAMAAGDPADAIEIAHIPDPVTMQSGWLMAGQALAAGMEPSALVCSNDEMAFGALRRLHEAGIAVPERVSVAGFDDARMAAFVTPTLTTVRQPLAVMGRRAAEQVFGALQAGRSDTAAEQVPTALQIRRSTGPAPRRGFSLIELLVVVAIVAVLAGMLMPALNTVREAARSTVCRGNLRQMTIASLAYFGDNEGQTGDFNVSSMFAFGGDCNTGWGALPTASRPLYTYFDAHETYLRTFRCPGDRGQAWGNYSATPCHSRSWYGTSYGTGSSDPVAHYRGVYRVAGGNPGVLSALTMQDRTILYSDIAAMNPDYFGRARTTWHRGLIANLAFVDGHVEGVSEGRAASWRGCHVAPVEWNWGWRAGISPFQQN